jgi:hypothetical protein
MRHTSSEGCDKHHANAAQARLADVDIGLKESLS